MPSNDTAVQTHEATGLKRVDTTYAGMRALRAEAKRQTPNHTSYTAALEAVTKASGHPAGWTAYVDLVEEVRGVGTDTRMQFASRLESLAQDAMIATAGGLRSGDGALWSVRNGDVNLSVTRGRDRDPEAPDPLDDNVDVAAVTDSFRALVSSAPLTQDHHLGQIHEVVMKAGQHGVVLSIRTSRALVFRCECHQGRITFRRIPEGRVLPQMNRDLDADLPRGAFAPPRWGFEKISTSYEGEIFKIAGTETLHGPDVDEEDPSDPDLQRDLDLENA